jgi:hypothetical protein
MAISVLALVVACYSAVATAYLEAQRRGETPPRWARALGPVTVAAHFAGLWILGKELQRSPFETVSEALSFLAFALAALYVLLEWTSRVTTHGAAFHGLAALLAALSVPGLVQTSQHMEAAAERFALRTWHIGLGLLSTAAVLTAGLLALGYLGRYARIKRRDPVQMAAAPSLASYQRLTRNASWLSTLLLVPSLVVGVQMGAAPQAAAGGVILAASTAVLFVVLLVAALIWWRRPLRGALAAWINLGAVVLLVVAFAIVHPLLVRGAAS